MRDSESYPFFVGFNYISCMKPLLLSLLITLSFLNVFAQPAKEKAVETDLRKCFDKINYWENIEHHNENIAWSDSLNKANQKFAGKLKAYATAYPFMLTLPFKSLVEDINIQTSADGMFRIFSWDTGLGGTMHNCGNVMLYKAGSVVKSIVTIGTPDDFNLNYYYKLFSINANGHTYYMAIESSSLGEWEYGASIKTFAIENGVLDDKVKIIKTASGLHNSISYTYNGAVEGDNPPNQDIEYNEATQTFTLPVVVAKGKVTRNRIIYKFTGQYFERLKN